MKDTETTPPSAIVNRRSFVKTTAVAGALITSKSRPLHAQSSTPPSEQLNVGLIGCGAQGLKQVGSIIGKSPIDGINFVAVCDIWDRAASIMYQRLKRYRHDLREYRLRGNAGQGNGHGRGAHRHARFRAPRPHPRLSPGRQSGLLRKDDVQHHRGCQGHGPGPA